MSRRVEPLRSAWATLALAAGVGVVLGLVASRSVRTVTGLRSGVAVQVAAMTGNAPSSVAVADSLLAAAVVQARDPFRAPVVIRTERAATTSREEQRVTGTPVIRALLYDNVNPTVQIGIGSVTSGWLHTGDHFQGWTVVEISSASVRIARNGESVVLPSS